MSTKTIPLVAFLTVFSIVSLTSVLHSQDTISAKYFPMHSGNVWYYKTTFSPIPFPPTFHKEYIEKDTIINGKKYFKYLKYGNFNYIRIDSVNGNLLAYSSGNGCGSYPNDKIIDSLASSPGDQITCLYQNISTRRCVSVSNETVFGILSDTKEFFHDGLFVSNVRYAKNFGVIYSCSGEPPPCSGFTRLIGCQINGIVYGDTNLVNITQGSSDVPENFSLAQNYPNPFNPTTNLEFGISNLGFVSLKVYDVLGNEIKTLVNENKPAGSYSVEFDGSDLSSGIYFYKLEAGNFVETKRMVLLK